MSIAEKLVTIAENQNEIYSKGLTEGGNSGWIAGRKQLEDNITNNGQRTRYANAFAYQDWTGYTFLTPIVVKDAINNMFFTYQGTELPQGIDCSQATGLPETMFRYSPNLVHIYDIKLPAPTRYQYTFGDMAAIKKIDIVRCNEDTVFTDTFRNVATLEEVTFSGVIGQNGLNLSKATLLTRESLLSILNCLQDKTGDTSATWTVTIGSANIAKLTADELQAAQAKNWRVV